MAAEKSPAFQFYPKDFLTDSHVVAMTLPERGAYITLLCLCWMDGSVPADMGALARLCRVPLIAFQKVWPALQPCFRKAVGRGSKSEARLVQPRIERERRKQATWREMKRKAGEKGGRPKAQVNSASPLLNHNESTTKAEGVAESSPPSSSPISDLQSNDHDHAFEQFWATYPKHTGRQTCLVFWANLKPSGALIQRILDGAGAYARHVSDWQPRFIKAPIKWLEGAHWDDELPSEPAATEHIPWVCPHEVACSSPTICRNATILNRPLKVKAS